MDTSLTLTLISCGSAILFMAVGFASYSQARRRRRDIQSRGEAAANSSLDADTDADDSSGKTSLKQRFHSTEYGSGLQQKLRQARLENEGEIVEASTFFVGTLWVAAIFAIVFWRFFDFPLLFTIPAMALAWFYIPNLILESMKKRSLKVFDEQLIEATSTIASAIRAGYSIPQAVRQTAYKLPSPSYEEFIQLDREINTLGTPVDIAFQNMLKRMPSDNLLIIVTTILIQKQSGGNVVRALNQLSDTMRVRVTLQTELDALLSGLKMTANIVAALPFVVLLMMRATLPDYVAILYTTISGFLVLVAAILLTIIGIYFLRKVGDVRV